MPNLILKNMKSLTLHVGISFVALLLFVSSAFAQNPLSNIKGDYLGQVPSSKAEVFAPEIISGGMYERDFTVSPDGNEIYYSLFHYNGGKAH